MTTSEYIQSEIDRLQPEFDQAEEQLAITRKGAQGSCAAYRRVGLLEGQLRALRAVLDRS